MTGEFQPVYGEIEKVNHHLILSRWFVGKIGGLKLTYLEDLGIFMVKKIFILSIIWAVILVACQNTPATVTYPPSAEVEVAGTIEESTPTEIATLPAATSTAEVEKSVALNESNCTVVSRQPTPGSTEQSLIPPVSGTDWVHGPEDAKVTIIEYGDFQ